MDPGRNLTLADYKFAQFTLKTSLHNLVKCKKKSLFDQQCACTASNTHVHLAAVEYLNISGLVIDFATSPVRTGNSFFASRPPWSVKNSGIKGAAYVTTCFKVVYISCNFACHGLTIALK